MSYSDGNGIRKHVLLEHPDGNLSAWVDEGGLVIQYPHGHAEFKLRPLAELELWAKAQGYSITYGRKM